MIKARHHQLSIWFLRNYFGLISFFHFRKTTIVSKFSVPENQAVLLLQNHFSWWDGYWSYLLCRNIFHRRFHVMMLEEQLNKRLFLNRCGAFSIRKNNRDSLNSLKYSSEILSNSQNLLAIYPTGIMHSQHRQYQSFQQGINRIFSAENASFGVVLSAVLVDYFGFARPEIRIYLENYSGQRTAEAIEKAYHEFYQKCVDQQTEK